MTSWFQVQRPNRSATLPSAHPFLSLPVLPSFCFLSPLLQPALLSPFIYSAIHLPVRPSIHLSLVVYHLHVTTDLQLLISWFLLEAPEIISFCHAGTKNCSTRKELEETDPAYITCQVSASPEALVYWSYRGLNASNPDGRLDTHISDNHNGTLKIENLKRNDTGFYRCYANNTQGDDDALMYLHVKGNRGQKHITRSLQLPY